MCATITLFRTDKFHETFVANHGFNQILCNTCDMHFITMTCSLLLPSTLMELQPRHAAKRFAAPSVWADFCACKARTSKTT